MDISITREFDVSKEIPPLPILLTVKQFAKLLDVDIRTVWRLKSNRAIPESVKFGGNVRWRGRDIQIWIDEGCPEDN